MHAFDIMAEAKMRQWQEDLRTGKAKLRSDPSAFSATNLESLERRLYREVRENVIRSHLVPEDQRQELLEEATAMQVQLAARLETSGFNQLSRLFAEEIQALKVRAREARQDKTLLQAILEEVRSS